MVFSLGLGVVTAARVSAAGADTGCGIMGVLAAIGSGIAVGVVGAGSIVDVAAIGSAGVLAKGLGVLGIVGAGVGAPPAIGDGIVGVGTAVSMPAIAGGGGAVSITLETPGATSIGGSEPTLGVGAGLLFGVIGEILALFVSKGVEGVVGFSGTDGWFGLCSSGI